MTAPNIYRSPDKFMATAKQDRCLANACACVKCEYLGLIHVRRTLEYSLSNN